MAIYEYECENCQVVREIEKPARRKGEYAICPDCYSVMKYTGYTIKHDDPIDNENGSNVVHLADFRLRKKGW